MRLFFPVGAGQRAENSKLEVLSTALSSLISVVVLIQLWCTYRSATHSNHHNKPLNDSFNSFGVYIQCKFMFSQGDTQTIPVAADADSCSFFQIGHISFPCFWKNPLGQPCTWSLLPALLKTSPPLTDSAQLAKSGRGQVTNPLWLGQGSTRVKQHTPVTHCALGIYSLTTHSE